MRVAAILTCYNRKDCTLASIEALQNAADATRELVVDMYLVDDGSTDGTYQEVSARFPQTYMSKGNGQLYWGGGMNQAWAQAAKGNYDFYLWLNDDTYLKKEALKELMKDSTLFDHQSIIVGVSEWLDGHAVSYSGYLLKNKVLMIPTGKPQKCDYFNGNIVLIPKKVFEKVGFLDPYFRHNLGDIDYGMRAGQQNINSYISSHVVGNCDSHRNLSPWCNPSIPLRKRIGHFRSPLTKGPKEVYRFERRHTSFVMAVFRSSIIYIRLVFPSLWILMGKPKLGQG